MVFNPWHEINELADLLGALGGAAAHSEQPPVNVWNGKDGVRMEFRLPGFAPGDVEVSVDGGVLTVKGERKAEEPGDGWRLVRGERFYGSFSRSFSLPFPVEEGEATASMKDGILTVTLPKAKSERPLRITVGGDEK